MSDGSLVIRADVDTKEVRALMQRLQQPRLNQALSVAVNDTARQVEREAEREVGKTLSLPMKRARTGIWVRPFSTAKSLTAIVRGSGSPIPLKVFNAHETEDGVEATIWGAKRLHPGAFIRGGNFPNRVELSLGDNVFHRAGTKRLPIEKTPGAAIAEAMVEGAVSNTLVRIGRDRMMANVMRQLDRYSRSWSGKRA